MRKTGFSIFVFFFVFIFMTFIPVNAEKIKIKTIDGVQVVLNPKNPAPPKGTPAKMILKEELSIGEGEQEEEMFSQMTGVAVDNNGNIYIVDREENIIKVFDSKGKFVRSFGKQGQGPGEMNGPIGLRITPNNELMVEDVMGQRLVFFSLNGKFLRNLSTAKALGLALVRIDSKGNIMGQQIVPAEGKLTREVKKYDNELNPLFTIASHDFPNILEGKIDLFDLVFFFELGKDDTIYYGNLKEYNIEIFN
ncbi:MAG: 6-bladed beta-propeller [Candidatus Aminicenantes bacterium]|nr:MAG: 6-bladed beta-propeller [Candidatus Aminicenantes bacterium]